MYFSAFCMSSCCASYLLSDSKLLEGDFCCAYENLLSQYKAGVVEKLTVPTCSENTFQVSAKTKTKPNQQRNTNQTKQKTQTQKTNTKNPKPSKPPLLLSLFNNLTISLIIARLSRSTWVVRRGSCLFSGFSPSVQPAQSREQPYSDPEGMKAVVGRCRGSEICG